MSAPIVGQPKDEYTVVEHPDGSKTRYPAVCLHLISDNAVNFLVDIFGSIVQNIVARELDARGLTPLKVIAKDGAARPE